MLPTLARRTNSLVKNVRPILSGGVRQASAYEGEGRTTVKVLNQMPEFGLMIDSYATFGFRLNNGITVLGPMVIFPKSVFSWQVDSSDDITVDSLKLFSLLEPKIDLLVIGVEGAGVDRSRVLGACRALRLNAEVLTAEHAASTFNFLNAEGRSVAGALIPPLQLSATENDLLQSSKHYANIYTRELTA